MKYLCCFRFLLIPIMTLGAVSIAFADHYETHGEIKLQHGRLSGFYSHYAANGLKLVEGSEYITLYFKEWISSANDMELALIPGKTANLRFNTFGDGEQPGSCTFNFYNVTENSANYKVTEDTTKYGCGIYPYEKDTGIIIDSVRPFER